MDSTTASLKMLTVGILLVCLPSVIQAVDRSEYLQYRPEKCLKHIDREIENVASVGRCIPRCLDYEDECGGVSYNEDSKTCSISASYVIGPCEDPSPKRHTLTLRPSATSTTSTTTTPTPPTTSTSTTETPTTTTAQPIIIQRQIEALHDRSGVVAGFGTGKCFDGNELTMTCLAPDVTTYSWIILTVSGSLMELKEVILLSDDNYAYNIWKIHIEAGMTVDALVVFHQFVTDAVTINPMSYPQKVGDDAIATKYIKLTKMKKTHNSCIVEIEVYGLSTPTTTTTTTTEAATTTTALPTPTKADIELVEDRSDIVVGFGTGKCYDGNELTVTCLTPDVTTYSWIIFKLVGSFTELKEVNLLSDSSYANSLWKIHIEAGLTVDALVVFHQFVTDAVTINPMVYPQVVGDSAIATKYIKLTKMKRTQGSCIAEFAAYGL